MSSICSIAAEAHAMKETGLKKFGQTCLEGSTYIVNIYFETIKLSFFCSCCAETNVFRIRLLRHGLLRLTSFWHSFYLEIRAASQQAHRSQPMTTNHLLTPPVSLSPPSPVMSVGTAAEVVTAKAQYRISPRRWSVCSCMMRNGTN